MVSQVRLYVTGDVTRVGFRAWARMLAKQHGINGWVRDNYDRDDIFGPGGGIEIVAQADEGELVGFVEQIQAGSQISHVEHVEVMIEKPMEMFDSFEVRATV